MDSKEFSKKFVFSVEGNIGVGKSTFLKKLNEQFNELEVILEPHKHWQSINGKNLLDFFYKNMQRWAYSFETYALMTRISCLDKIEESKKNIFVLERSIMTNYNTFGKACYLSGLMNEMEWVMYGEFYNWIIEKEKNKPNFFIYLRASPDTCYERINKRKRSEEERIEKNYLEILHQYHDNWLFKERNIPVLTLDVDFDFEHNINEWNLIQSKIKNFISEKILR